jgi:hypothetical protein
VIKNYIEDGQFFTITRERDPNCTRIYVCIFVQEGPYVEVEEVLKINETREE